MYINSKHPEKFLCIFFILILHKTSSYEQAKSSIGLGPAFNLSADGSGAGVIFQGELKLTKSISIAPALGIEVPYLVHVGLAGRYYLQPEFYLLLGGFTNAGVQSANARVQQRSYGGAGGTAGPGFALPLNKQNVLDFNLHFDMLRRRDDYFLLGGIRVTYNFAFSKINYSTN